MFFTTVYMPQDQDIIREAWVMGDLKDQLGIQHRRDRRRGRAPEHAGGDLETAPMYKNPHMRSTSEIDHSYQPVLARSPQTGADALAAPPPAHSRSTSPAPGFDDDAQYIVVDRSPTRQDPPGSRLSYYSVSNIPPPSPLPPTRYSTVSNASHPGTPRRRSSTKAAAPLLSPVHREKYLHTGPSSPPPVSYEMRVRSPPAEAGSIPPSPYERRDMSRASNRSYATAEYATAEDYRPGEDEDPPASADLGVPGQRHDRPESPWQGVIAE
jgi:phospholipid-translocating ATPase